jgi:hypothetical protein
MKLFEGRNGLNWLQLLWYGKIWFTIRYCWYPALMGRRGVKTTYKKVICCNPDFKVKVTIIEK